MKPAASTLPAVTPSGRATPPVPPGPRGFWAPVRNLLELRRDPPAFFLKLAREYGPVSSLQFLGRRLYFFAAPEGVREVLVTQADSMQKGFLVKRIWESLVGVMGNGLLTSEGEFHARQRRLVVPSFHRERLARYAAIMVENTAAHTARWTDGQSMDFAEEMSHLTLGIVGQSLFGANLGQNAEAIGQALGTLMSLVERTRSPLQQLPWSRSAREYEHARTKLDEVVLGMITARRASGEHDRGDLLSVLMLARDEETGGPGMTDTQIRDEVMTIMLAGHETTASALAWTFHLLAQRPEVETLLHAELDEVLPPGYTPTLADLSRLVYTRQVLSESMRLYPPAWILARRTTEAVTVAGWSLPANAACVLSPYASHRDPRWFPEPERFLPERWEKEAAAARPKHAYFPFGGGPRSCAGEAFAWMEGTLLLAEIARNWRLAPDAAYPPPEKLAAITLRPRRGMRMRSLRRTGTGALNPPAGPDAVC